VTGAQLENFPLLNGIPAPLLQQLEAATHLQVFAAGDEIVTAGQPSHGRVYFVESGQVSVLVPLDDGAHHRITSLSAGMSFGEMVLLGQTTRSATVHADTTVTCRVLESQDLEKIAEQAPMVKIVLLENLAKEMANSLRRATKWIAALA
jgi:glutaminase